MARIVEGDAGKAICREAERLKPAAVVMGTRGRGIIQRSVSVRVFLSFPFVCASVHLPLPWMAQIFYWYFYQCIAGECE